MSEFHYCIEQNKPCIHWVEKIFSDCLCNLRDDFSFAFGLISLICWGVAEVPQIITNFITKSSHGVSLAFLLTWIAGDVFNLVGCVLEPATLPTQYYTALLYTISTVVLVLQSLYYDYIHKRLKGRHGKDKRREEEEDEIKPLKAGSVDPAIPIPEALPKSSSRPEYYYTSARSLASSGTPPFRAYLRAARSGPSAMGLENDSSSSSDDEAGPTLSATRPRPIPRSAAAGYGTFLAASVNLPLQTNAFSVGFTTRKLLQHGGTTEHSAFGQWLGWMMAAIYMGGRIPQIWLNIKRGSVEGLNPLMFIFALAANVTYVLSIVVRNTEWHNIKANLPWLLDAVVCVILDLFIILQYIYYRYFRKRTSNHGEDSRSDFPEASKLNC